MSNIVINNTCKIHNLQNGVMQIPPRFKVNESQRTFGKSN